MKKVKITESELVSLIEKLVKENFAQGAANGNGQNFGIMGTPTAKYKEIFEKEDIEEDEENIDTAQDADQTLNLNVMKKTNQTDWMENVNEQSAARLMSDLESKFMQYQDDEDCCGNLAVLIDRFNGLLKKHGEEVPFHVVLDEIGMILNKSNQGMTTESQLISRLKRRLNEGKCPKSGCITKRGKKWRIISNKTGK